MSAKEFIVKHKYALAGSVLGLGLLYLIFGGGGNSDSGVSSTGANPSEVAANTALQQAMVAANQQNMQAQAAANVAISGQNTQLAETQIAAHTTENVASINANNNAILAQLQAQTSQLIATLQAQVADTTTAAGVETTRINDNALVTVALAPYMNLNAAELAQLNANTGAIAGLGTRIDTTATDLAYTNKQVTNIATGTNEFIANQITTNKDLAKGIYIDSGFLGAGTNTAAANALSPVIGKISSVGQA